MPGRFWEFLKPPPDPGRKQSALSSQERRRRKRLVGASLIVIAMGLAAWEIYSYLDAAAQRAQAAFQTGRRLLASGKTREAIEQFSQALRISPQMGESYLERGLAHADLHEDDAAIEDFNQAIHIDATLSEAHTALGNIYRARGDLRRAVAEYNIAIGLGSSTEANYQRAQMYESLGEHEKAIEDYNRTIDGNPDAPAVYRARAISRENLGDAAGARADREKADSIEHPSAPAPVK